MVSEDADVAIEDAVLVLGVVIPRDDSPGDVRQAQDRIERRTEPAREHFCDDLFIRGVP